MHPGDAGSIPARSTVVSKFICLRAESKTGTYFALRNCEVGSRAAKPTCDRFPHGPPITKGNPSWKIYRLEKPLLNKWGFFHFVDMFCCCVHLNKSLKCGVQGYRSGRMWIIVCTTQSNCVQVPIYPANFASS